MRRERSGRALPAIPTRPTEVEHQDGGGMGLLTLLAWPLLAPYKLVAGAAGAVKQQLDSELYSPEQVQEQLRDLQARHDLGELGDEEFEADETALLQALDELIRGERGRRTTR